MIDHIDFLRDAVRQTRKEKRFHIDLWVFLPEHIHSVWTLPLDDDNYARRWRLIKSHFSHHVAKAQNLTHNAKGSAHRPYDNVKLEADTQNYATKLTLSSGGLCTFADFDMQIVKDGIRDSIIRHNETAIQNVSLVEKLRNFLHK